MTTYSDVIDIIRALEAQDAALRAEYERRATPFQAQAVAADPMAEDPPEMLALRALNSARRKHREWARKLCGIARGYERESQLGHLAMSTGRSFGFDDADVTVGTTEEFAMAVQFKATQQDDESAVSAMIAAAANQLTGEKGETPNPGQQKVIDVSVASPLNWWPYGSVDFRDLDLDQRLDEGVIGIADFKAHAEASVLKCLTNYTPKKTGLNGAVIGSLFNHVRPVGSAAADIMAVPDAALGAERMIFGPRGGHPSGVILTTVHYDSPKTLGIGGGATEEIRRLDLVAYRENGALIVRCARHM